MNGIGWPNGSGFTLNPKPPFLGSFVGDSPETRADPSVRCFTTDRSLFLYIGPKPSVHRAKTQTLHVNLLQHNALHPLLHLFSLVLI